MKKLILSIFMFVVSALGQNTTTWVSSPSVLSNTAPAATRLYAIADVTGGAFAAYQWSPSSSDESDGINVIKWSGASTGRWVKVQLDGVSSLSNAVFGPSVTLNSVVVKTNLTVSGVQVAAKVNSVSALKALVVTQDKMRVSTLGYYAPGDGGGADYYFDASSSAAADDGSVIQPTSGGGRFILIQDGSFNVKVFGPIAGAGYGATNSSRIQAAIDYASTLNGGQVVFTELYRVSSTITLKRNVKLFSSAPATYTEAPSIVTNVALYKGGYAGGLALETGANVPLINCDASGGYIRQTNVTMWDDSVITEKRFLNSGISGLLLQGNDSNQTNTVIPLIKACYLWNLTVENCLLASSSGPAVWFRDCNGVSFRNNYILGGRGVWLDDLADSDLSKNWTYGSLGPSWLLISSWKNTFEGNHTGNAVSGLSGNVSSVSGNILSTSSSHNLYTGQYVWVSSTGSVPSPLVSTRPYSVIRLSATTFSLATSLTNADLGTAVTLTTTGSGTISYTAGPAVSWYLASPSGPSTAGATGTKRNSFIGNRSDQTLEGGFFLDGASENTIASSYIIEAGFDTATPAKAILLTNSASYNTISGFVIDNSSDIGVSIGQNCNNNVFSANAIAAPTQWEWSSTGTANNYVPVGSFTSSTNIYSGATFVGAAASGNVATFTGGAGGASIVQIIRSGQPTVGFRASAGFLLYDETNAKNLGRFSWSGSSPELVVGGPSATSPVLAAVSGEKASGTDVGGQNLYINAGQGTGAGSVANAQVRIRTPTVGSSGTSLQTMNDRAMFDSTSDSTLLPMWLNHNGTLKQVQLGAADSGGAGFRMLRIVN